MKQKINKRTSYTSPRICMTLLLIQETVLYFGLILQDEQIGSESWYSMTSARILCCSVMPVSCIHLNVSMD